MTVVGCAHQRKDSWIISQNVNVQEWPSIEAPASGNIAAHALIFEPPDDNIDVQIPCAVAPHWSRATHIFEFVRSFVLPGLFSKNKGKKAPLPPTSLRILRFCVFPGNSRRSEIPSGSHTLAYIGNFCGRERQRGMIRYSHQQSLTP